LSKQLDEVLRELARKGELNYISLVPIAHKDAINGVGFSATYAPATNCGHGFGRDADPVTAILEAVEDWAKKRRNLRREPEPEIIAEKPRGNPWD